MLHHVTFWAITGGVIALFLLFFIWARRRTARKSRDREILCQIDDGLETYRGDGDLPDNHDIPEVWSDNKLDEPAERSSGDVNHLGKLHSPRIGTPPASEPELTRSAPDAEPRARVHECRDLPASPRRSSRWSRWGQAGLSYDQRMKLHKPYPVVAEIAAPGVSLKITFGKEVENIPISDLMTCHLQGEHFDIVALHHDEQILLPDRPTIWKWNVVPQRTGIRKLTLVVSRKIKKGENTGYHDEPVLERYASIHVDPIHETGRFMVKNWQWIAGTIAGSGVLWHFLGKGK